MTGGKGGSAIVTGPAECNGLGNRGNMEEMGEWWESREGRWLRRHAIAAPVGILLVTILLTYLTQPEQWNQREGLKSAASLVDLGTVVYATVAVILERGVRIVFWALDQRRKWREKWRAEAQAEGRAEGLAEGLAEGRAEGRAEFIAELVAAGREQGNQEIAAFVERVAREQGGSLEEDSHN